jgi:pyruvyltransferase
MQQRAAKSRTFSVLPPCQAERREAVPANTRIGAFWCRIPSLPNFGDALTPWLIRRITGQYPRFVPPDDPCDKYFVTGSIVEYTRASCTVWGSGIMTRHDLISPAAEFLAVRGPLTRARAMQCGAFCPEVYGDPALLLPRLYRPAVEQRQGMGLVAHFSDKPRLAASLRAVKGLKLVDIQAPIESVIDQIVSCEFVASSSLHGLVASHAYGVPAVRVMFRPLPSGDGVKFDDYFLSIGQEPPLAVPLEYDHVDLGILAHHAVLPSMRLDIELLWSVCPFRGIP